MTTTRCGLKIFKSMLINFSKTSGPPMYVRARQKRYESNRHLTIDRMEEKQPQRQQQQQQQQLISSK